MSFAPVSVAECFSAARALLNGYGVAVDHKSGLELLHKAANLGSADAMFTLSRLYESGLFVEANWRLSVELVKKAAQAGHSEAMYTLATYHGSGECDVELSDTKLEMWLQASAAFGCREAIEWLKQLKTPLRGLPRNVGAFPSLINPASKEEYLLIARQHIYGIATKADPRVGVSCFSEAASRGCVESISALVTCYKFGQGVDRDVDVALRHLKRGAELNSAECLLDLASLHFEGMMGFSRNLQLAQELTERAAKLNYSKAFVELLKSAHNDGKPEAAVTFCKRAVDLGDLESLLFLAQMTRNNYGGLKHDPKVVSDILRRAAKFRVKGATDMLRENQFSLFNMPRGMCSEIAMQHTTETDRAVAFESFKLGDWGGVTGHEWIASDCAVEARVGVVRGVYNTSSGHLLNVYSDDFKSFGMWLQGEPDDESWRARWKMFCMSP